MKPKIIAYGELTLLALGVALLFWWIVPNSPKEVTQTITPVATTTRVAYFPEVELEAKAAYVYDTAEGRALYEKDPELQWPLASLTKLMSALTAAALVPEYTLVTITSDDLREEGDSGLYPSEQWNIRKLIDYSLVVSSNDGMRAIASIAGSQLPDDINSAPELRFIDEMNRKAREIGLTQTYFLNQSGLDLTTALSGGYGSAKDMAILVDYILKNDPHLLEATTFDQINIDSKLVTHPATNTNKAILNVPNILGSKTGFTDLSGGNVVVAWNAGIDHPIIISVLGSSYDGRFEDLSKLIEATLTYLGSSTSTVSIPESIR